MIRRVVASLFILFGVLEFTLGADVFGGDEAGAFGRFRDRDRVTLETNLHF